MAASVNNSKSDESQNQLDVFKQWPCDRLNDFVAATLYVFPECYYKLC